MICHHFHIPTKPEPQKSYLATLADHSRAELSRANLTFEFTPATKADKDFYSSFSHDVRMDDFALGTVLMIKVNYIALIAQSVQRTT